MLNATCVDTDGGADIASASFNTSKSGWSNYSATLGATSGNNRPISATISIGAVGSGVYYAECRDTAGASGTGTNTGTITRLDESTSASAQQTTFTFTTNTTGTTVWFRRVVTLDNTVGTAAWSYSITNAIPANSGWAVCEGTVSSLCAVPEATGTGVAVTWTADQAATSSGTETILYNYSSAVNFTCGAVTQANVSATTEASQNYTIALTLTELVNESFTFNYDISSQNCYQETATTATACGGLATGSYIQQMSGILLGGLPVTNSYDKDWGTWTGDPGGMGMYVNYTKPAMARDSSVWQVKDGDGTANLTIYSACWAQSPLQLLVISDQVNNWGNWSCYDGSAWLYLRNASAVEGYKIYEEGMWWNVTPVLGHTSNNTYGTALAGDGGWAGTAYYFGDWIDGEDFAGLNWTQNTTVQSTISTQYFNITAFWNTSANLPTTTIFNYTLAVSPSINGTCTGQTWYGSASGGSANATIFSGAGNKVGINLGGSSDCLTELNITTNASVNNSRSYIYLGNTTALLYFNATINSTTNISFASVWWNFSRAGLNFSENSWYNWALDFTAGENKTVQSEGNISINTSSVLYGALGGFFPEGTLGNRWINISQTGFGDSVRIAVAIQGGGGYLRKCTATNCDPGSGIWGGLLGFASDTPVANYIARQISDGDTLSETVYMWSWGAGSASSGAGGGERFILPIVNISIPFIPLPPYVPTVPVITGEFVDEITGTIMGVEEFFWGIISAPTSFECKGIQCMGIKDEGGGVSKLNCQFGAILSMLVDKKIAVGLVLLVVILPMLIYASRNTPKPYTRLKIFIGLWIFLLIYYALTYFRWTPCGV